MVAKVRQLRDQEESELKKIAGKEERDLVTLGGYYKSEWGVDLVFTKI